MSDQNRFDEYKQKLLHYWSLFIAACGRIWEKTKICAGEALDFLRRHGKTLAQKLAAWLLKVRDWLKKMLEVVSRYAMQALRKLAAWALVVREKVRPVIRGIREKVRPVMVKTQQWLAPVKAKVQQFLPAPRELSPAEEAEEAENLPADGEEEQAMDEEKAEQAPKTVAREFRITDPTLLKAAAVLGVAGKYGKLIVKWIWKLRTVFMAIPVVWTAIKLAAQNMSRLPESVGLDIQSSGEFARMITRQEAVYWPLGITAFCLLLMFCSKKPLLPWVISIFTLVLPVLIWVLNYYA